MGCCEALEGTLQSSQESGDHSVLIGTVGCSPHSCWLGKQKPWEGASQATSGHVYLVNKQSGHLWRFVVPLMVGALVSMLKGRREIYAGPGACSWGPFTPAALEQGWSLSLPWCSAQPPPLCTPLSPHTGPSVVLSPQGIACAGLCTCFVLYLAQMPLP